MILTDWNRNKILCESLGETLNQDHVKLALSVLEAIGSPHAAVAGQGSPDISATNDQRMIADAFREGWYAAIHRLRLLAVYKPEIPPKKELEPWEHTEAPDPGV